jgi:hypothetical protein
MLRLFRCYLPRFVCVGQANHRDFPEGSESQVHYDMEMKSGWRCVGMIGNYMSTFCHLHYYFEQSILGSINSLQVDSK